MATKTKYGYMKCPDCPERVVVKVNEHGTLSYTCDECDSSAYARKGTGVYTSWHGRITRAEPAAAPAKKTDDAKSGDQPPVKRGVLDSL